MNTGKKEEVHKCIISLGGSLIVPDKIDWKYLQKFRDFIISRVENNWEFIIITGGGSVARDYVNAAGKIDETMTDADKDWIGIHTTRLNAQLMRTILRDYAYPRVNTNPHDLEDFSNCKESIVIAAGYRPGCSTDYDATLLAKYLDIPFLVNLSNIDYACDKDPKKFPDAKKIEQTTWAEFRKVVGDEWKPGLNAPFDPIASKLAEEIGLEVAIMNGQDLENLGRYLDGGQFVGTRIQ